VKSKPATKSQRARMLKIKEIGCLICGNAPCDAHHLLSGGYRRGHDFTIGLCKFHHTESEDFSYHRAKKRFNANHGTDDELLAKQNEILEYFPNGRPNE